MIIGSLVLGNPENGWMAIILIVAGVLSLILNYAKVSRSRGSKLLLGGLKFLGLALIALCLLNPQWSARQITPGENIVLVLADKSASMQIQQSGQPLGETFREQLADPKQPWQVRLGQDFDVRHYEFGARVAPSDAFLKLDFDDGSSQLISTLNTLTKRYRQQPLAGIVLFTDGNATDASGKLESDIPIFPVVMSDSPSAPKDIRIEQVSVSQTPFEDAPVTVQATIKGTSIGSTKVVAKLTGPDDFKQSQVLDISDESQATARFQFSPKSAGIQFYELVVHLASEPNALAPQAGGAIKALRASEASSESTLANNTRLVVVDRGVDKHRILYVGGRPNWEHKFMNRALHEDEQVHLVSLIRIARKEAKFDFRGRAGESANSLFRGFDDVDEETEEYDQPVLKPINVRDGKELSDGFPQSKEVLYEYEAIILDDVEAEFFTHDQMALLDRFVAERGGGLLMLGGRDSFRHGGWHKTPLRDAMPVYMDRPAQAAEGPLEWDLTRDGWLEPWMRLRENEQNENQRISSMPAFSIFNQVDEVKPGARQLALLENQYGDAAPALVSQQYGKGRSAALLIGDLWKWALKRSDDNQDDLAKAWRQITRWLIADVPAQVQVDLDWTQLGQAEAVNLNVRVHDKKFQPQDNAAVQIQIAQPGKKKKLRLDATPSLEEPGLFQASYAPRERGAYTATVEVTDEQGIRSGSVDVGWTSDPTAAEFQQTAIDLPLLENLAEKSGGQIVKLDELENFVTTLPLRDLPVMEVSTTSIWHTPILLMAALACFAVEWGLRRWKGLP